MGSITSLSKQAIKILICFCLVYTPFFASAYDPSSWSIDDIEYNKKSNAVEIQARKISNTAVKNAKYFTDIPVSASTLGSSAKMLIRGGLASAAIYGIVEGVGWIIDQGVVKKKANEDVVDPSFEYVWSVNIGITYISPTASGLCKKAIGTNTSLYSYSKVESINIDTADCYWIDIKGSLTGIAGKEFKNFRFNRIKNQKYDPTFKPTYVPVSDNELGNEIIKSPAAPQVIPDIYNPNSPTKTPARDASSDALDKAIPGSDPKGDVTKKPNKDTDGDGKPDVYDPELPDQGFDFKLPEFCDWASVVCVWYEKYSEDSKKADQQREDEKSFWETVKDWFDWTKEDPDLPDEDTELDIPDPEVSDVDTNISFGGQCPAARSIPVSFAGISTTFELSFEWLCQIASIAKPVVISVSAFSAALIIAGIRTEDD
jgi:hypothetical protein